MLDLHVVFAVDRAGLVGEDGETHHGVFDVGFLRQAPNLKILCPGSQLELSHMLTWAVEKQNSPVAIRYPRGTDGSYKESAFIDGDSRLACHRQGKDVVILTYGSLLDNALLAAEILHEQGVEATVLRLLSLSHIPAEEIAGFMQENSRLVVVEDACENSGIKERLGWELTKMGQYQVDGLDLGHRYVTHALLSSCMNITASAVKELRSLLWGVFKVKIKKRLDVLLVEQGYADNRTKAQAIIMSGQVYVEGQKADKPGTSFEESVSIEVRGAACPYVSRGGLKLEKALRDFGVDPTGFVCSDSGASTGGFTDSDPRVVVMERTNVRYVTPEQLGEPLDLSVIDVSFISLKIVLPVIKTFLKPECGQVLCLIKPQFEAGKEKVGKKGVVRDPETHKQVLDDFVELTKQTGFTILGLTFSPVKGPEGNIEFLGHLTLADKPGITPDTALLVQQAHEALKG